MDDNKDKLMSHEYDGIQEFDNNLPPWWLYGFYLTIMIGIIYMFYYHVAEIGPSSQMEYQNEEYAAFLKHGNSAASSAEMEYTLMTDQANLDAGKAIYASTRNACFTCHGNEAQGLVGPNLTDEYWLNGGDIKSIATSIKEGNIQKGMQPYGMGNAVRLSDEELLQVTSYLISLQGSNPPNPKPVDETRAKKFEGSYK